ncbi:MAG: hypothetical protein HYV13_01860 [Candidatus Doudnabacteria bacterium]|nr:hypothetical protein [Candidatus Doudnabacteria bacterium]
MKNKYKFWIIACLVVAVLALPALAEIKNPSKDYLVDFGTCPADATPGTACNSFGYLFTFFIRQLLVVAGVLAIFFIIYSGFQYITSGVNEEWAEAGKKGLRNAIIGLSIIILSYIIVSVINNALSKPPT